MELIVITTDNSKEFQKYVIEPLENLYPYLKTINIDQAIKSFYPNMDHKSWDIVIIEMRVSELNDNALKQSLSIFTKYPEISASGLSVAAAYHSEVVVCYLGEMGEKMRRQYQNLYIYFSEIFNFDSKIVDELWLILSAGFKSSWDDVNYWLELSSALDEKDYPILEGKLKELLTIEIPDSLQLANFVMHIWECINKYEISILRQLVILMRVARYLANLEYEGVPFSLTCILAIKLPPSEHLLYNFSNKKIAFSLHSESTLRRIGELAQSKTSFIYLSLDDGIMKGIYKIPHKFENKIQFFKNLAKEYIGFVFHLPGNRTVEFYSKKDQRLKYNGFSWDSPLSDLNTHLFFLDSNFKNQLVETIEILSYFRFSTIIAIDSEDFNFPTEVLKLEPLRSENPPIQQIDDIDVETLVSIFRLDGAHFIDSKGKIVKMAHKVENLRINQSRSMASGTGRRAAEILSRVYSNSVVIKISASNGAIKIYKKGVMIPPENQRFL